MAVLLALIYAELGGMLPVAGAIARIPYYSHGGMSGLMAGWLCWIAYVATAPIEVSAVLQYASNYLPWLTQSEAGDRVLTASGLAVAAALLLVFLLVNLAGVRWLARANTAITAWKLVIPVVASIALIIVGFNSANFTAFGFAPMGADGVFAAVSAGGVMFSLFGFRTAIDMAGEADEPAGFRSAGDHRRGRREPCHRSHAAGSVHRDGAASASGARLGQRVGERSRGSVRGVRHHPRHAVAWGRALLRCRAIALGHGHRLHRGNRAHQLRIGAEQAVSEPLPASQP